MITTLRRYNGLNRNRKNRSRASVMLEFALVFPIALAIMLFAVDMGRLALLSTGLHDATAVAARAGARQGFVGTEGSGPARAAFNEAANVLPGLGENVTSFKIITPSTNTAAGNRTGRWCTQNELYVKITAVTHVEFITPGLGSLLNVTTGKTSTIPGAVDISSTGVARCEVAR